MRVVFAGLIVAFFVGVALASPVPQGAAKWVTLKGKVVWPETKPIPDPKFHNITPNHPDGAYTLRGGPVLDEELLVHAKTRGLKHVVVWLRPDNDLLAAKAAFPTELIHHSLTKPKSVQHTVTISFCRYDRRVLAARVGDTLEFVNNSAVATNAKLGGTNDFNILIPPDRSHVSKPFVADISPVWFDSSVHPWMKGLLRVFDHPYYAITDEHGHFEMKQVPIGKWRMMYWHELGFHKGRDGRLGYPIEVKDDGAAKRALSPVEYLAPEK